MGGQPEFRRAPRPEGAARRQLPEAEQQKLAKEYPGLARFGRVVSAGGQTRSTTLSRLWRLEYGGSGPSGDALGDYHRFLQTRDERFLREAEATAGRYLQEGFPTATHDLWPRAAGQVISLCVALSGEEAVPAEKRARYAKFARDVADRAIPLFSKNGLFRADGSAVHYEAITGTDDLLWALLQLHCALDRPDHRIGFIDVNY